MNKGNGEGGSAYPKSVQAGIPKLSNPAGWSVVRIGDIFRVVQRPVDLQDDAEYQLVTAKRNRGGVVPREQLTGKAILTKSQFRIAAGDFLISRRQIAHGACGIVPEALAGAIVSNEYATLLPTDLLDPGFMRHLPESIYFQQTCFHSSIGVHVEKLVFNLESWLKWQIALPDSAEQRRISAVLDAWDEGINTLSGLAPMKRIAEQALYDRISRQWPRLEIERFGRLVGGGTPSKKELAFWSGNVPWVSSKDMDVSLVMETQDYISRSAIDGSATRLVPAGSVLMVVRSGILRHTLPIALAAREVAINQDIKALIPTEDIDSQLLALILRLESDRIRQLTMKVGTTVESIDIDALKEYPLPFPKAEDQNAVAELLGALGDEVRILDSRLALLRRQKRSMMQKLLTGEWPVPEDIDRLMPGGDATAALARDASAA